MTKIMTDFNLFMKNVNLRKLSLRKGFLGVAVIGMLLTGCSKTIGTDDSKPIVITKMPDLGDPLAMPTGIITIKETGEKVDLAQLKEQYGDLYSMVEPLTKAQINKKLAEILYIYHNFAILNDKLYANGQKTLSYYGHVEPGDKAEYLEYIDIQAPIIQKAYATLGNSLDPKLSKFGSYYLEKDGNYGFWETMGITAFFEKSDSTILTDSDKEIIVRNYNTRLYIESKVLQSLDLDPKVYFDKEVEVPKIETK